MGMVDSYGYFWALNDVLETVCGGKWVDVQAGKRSHRKRHRTAPDLSINSLSGHKGREVGTDGGNNEKTAKGRPKIAVPRSAEPILIKKTLSLRKKARKLGVSKDTVRKWQKNE